VAKGSKKTPGQSKPPPAAAAVVTPRVETAANTVVAPNGALRLLVLDARLLWQMLGVAALVLFAWLVRDVLVSLILVGVLTFVGAPVVAWLERHRFRRSLGALAFALGAVLFVAALISLLVPALVHDFSSLIERLPSIAKELAAWLAARGVALPTRLEDLSDEASKEVLDFVRGGVGPATSVLKGAWSAASVVLDAVLVPVLTYFALADLPRAKRVVASVVPKTWRPTLAYYVPLVEVTLGKLVRGQLLVAGIMAALYSVGLSISGVPLFLAIGVISGCAYFVPFASGVVAFVLSAAFCVIEQGTGALPHIIGVVITVGVVMGLEAYVLTPRIVGEQAGLSPLAAIVAVILGAAAAGLLGALFALPVSAVIALVLREHARQGAPLASEDSA
jgi:predicted PurR-regulated permease PerM